MKLGALKRAGRRAWYPVEAGAARLRQLTPRPTRFAGDFPTVEAARASLPSGRPAGYDHDAVVDVSFEQMTRVALWDYPVIYWLRRLGGSVLDAGGHMGTKYIAFADKLPLDDMPWTVYDVPAVIRGAKQAQAKARIPAAIGFHDQLDACPPADILLASGLMQYVEMPLREMVASMARRPRTILLNKVAVTEGPNRVTLEWIGPAQVPYQIRNRKALETEFTEMGYCIEDSWEIPQLAHRIPTHPWLAPSQSRGYVLTDIRSDGE